MIKQTTPDFTQGYKYASRHFPKLLKSGTARELLEMAQALSEDTGVNAELARGMAAYCKEMARNRQGTD
ncbi:MAG: hypothetical protein P4N41_14025 [Negativicutes bacterium]|nr:hypothetical protein [Negativicutes bacterium]